ncbi:uncharacterized protein OCT59_002226 [Rhizophagus irregularis]|uniref:uncharacterized protein n=1 Tax=Rhizophagus irregularis TaxID=588596 RepID=UPI0019E879E8|nr:hypothetical protein OCT59_002226 [Rhizophagus irregularis]GET66326.1 hypothetical protein GLOIN_2v1486184 [Rhizophagus irregularis DAOM 181602=DAOM 197198]
MPNKKFNKNLNHQILALNEAIRQEKSSSSIDCNNPVAISPDYATSTSIPPTPIRASKPSNRWTSAEIRILIKEVGEHQQALQKLKIQGKKAEFGIILFLCCKSRFKRTF